MTSPQHSTVVFSPHLSMGSTDVVGFGALKIWNFPKLKLSELPDEKTRTHIERIFNNYRDFGQAQAGIGVVSIDNRSIFADTMVTGYFPDIREAKLAFVSKFRNSRPHKYARPKCRQLHGNL